MLSIRSRWEMSSISRASLIRPMTDTTEPYFSSIRSPYSRSAAPPPKNEQPYTGHLRKHRDHPLHLFERIDFALMLRERRDPDPFFPFVRPCKRFGFCIQRVPHARRNGYRRQVEPQCEENFAVAFDRRFELYQFFILQRNERLFLFPAFIDISDLCAAQPQDAPRIFVRITSCRSATISKRPSSELSFSTPFSPLCRP